MGRKSPTNWLGSNTMVTIIGMCPSPSSTMMGIKVTTASMDRWKVVLVKRAMEKYFCLKYRKSRKGSLLRCCTTINKANRDRKSRFIGM